MLVKKGEGQADLGDVEGSNYIFADPNPIPNTNLERGDNFEYVSPPSTRCSFTGKVSQGGQMFP